MKDVILLNYLIEGIKPCVKNSEILGNSKNRSEKMAVTMKIV